MDDFEEFSNKIEVLTKVHSSSWLARASCKVDYWWRRYVKKEPMTGFRRTDEQNRDVGKPIDIFHIGLYDMMEHQACGKLTEKVLLDGICVNSFRVLDCERVGAFAITTIQPCWI